MLMTLDTTWMVFAVTAVGMSSYLFSIGLDAVLGKAGFGVVGNAAIITAGFFGGIHAANLYGVRFGSLLGATLAGLAGAFAALLLLVTLKFVLNRLV